MSALLRNFNAKIVSLGQATKKTAIAPQWQEEDRPARLPPAQARSPRCLAQLPSAIAPGSLFLLYTVQKKTGSFCQSVIDTLSHLLLIRICTPLTLGLD